MGDYGSMTVMPFHGTCHSLLEHQSSAYSVDASILKPNQVRTRLLRYGIDVEMAPTERAALFVFTRQQSEAIRVRFSFEGEHTIGGDLKSRSVRGISRNHHGGVSKSFGLHFVAKFDTAPEVIEITVDGGVLTFPRNLERVEMRLAASFIDDEHASESLAREVHGMGLTELIAAGAGVWNDLLGRIQFEAREEREEQMLYSCLYRCLLFPRFMDEINSRGETVHHSPYDGAVHAGSLCTDNGFWDTFRTVYPLLALVYPDKLRHILQGWLAACRESGWSPKWPSPGPRDCMIGTHFDAVVADAVARGITDWDVEEAFSYLWRDATEQSEDGCFGRRGLNDYIRLGYVPCDKFPYGVSSTLDYAYNDFCVAQVATFLGRTREANLLKPRTQSYRNIFDASTGFMRGRRADGAWDEPFEEFQWGGSYIEGGPWQHSFNVPHDPEGLAELFGSNTLLCRKLDTMLATPPRFETGRYGFEIHEMTEMALAGFGQYAHSNQPVHNFLFLYSSAGEPEKTAHWVHRVARELYSPKHFPGDEDNGEMAAWYVFACLGLFPSCPGKPGFVKFPPLALNAKINGTPIHQLI